MEGALTAELANGAVIDTRGRFRYRLWRTWDASRPRACFVMLNPSTADADTNDPTLRRCLGFAASHGFGGVDVVNLFALRSANPQRLRHVPDAAGEGNAAAIEAAIARCALTVAAWGVLGGDAWRRYPALGDVDLFCLGETKAGAPRHPLYVPGTTRLRPWRPPSAAFRRAG